ncbi:MAG: C40 family peptidase [Candidatus Dormibacteria bacterium]
MRTELEELRRRAEERYGSALIEVWTRPTELRGVVALESQAEELARMLHAHWPQAEPHLVVLARRRARLGLEAADGVLEVLRRPGGRELTTQLLPGDPPAEVLARRDGHYLVRAAGEALGWVVRGAGRRVPAPGPALAPPQTYDRELVMSAALALLGRDYVFGGTGGPGVDCSGLTWRAFQAAGVALPRNSRAQRRVGRRVRLSELEGGDLVLAVHRSSRRTSHVALALGPEELVHACYEQRRVLREPLAEFTRRYQVLSVRRLPGARPELG